MARHDGRPWTSSTQETGMIRLGQLLKAAGLVDSGGDAKLAARVAGRCASTARSRRAAAASWCRATRCALGDASCALT